MTDYLQQRFLQKLNGKEPQERKVYKIANRSAKRVHEDKTLKKMFIERFLIDRSCQLKSPVCTFIAQCLDHLQKTSPGNRLMPKNLVMSCFMCNGFRETSEGQAWAIKNGHHVSRFKK